MKTPIFLFCCALTLGTLPQAGAQAVLIFDDFLTDNLSSPGTNVPGVPAQPGFIQWRVTDGFVDLVGPATIPTGDVFGRYVDLVGSPIVDPATGLAKAAAPGLFSFAQPLALLADVSYTLSFFYNSVDAQPNSARVTLAGQSFTISSSSATFTQFQQAFTFPQAVNFMGLLSPVAESPLTFQDLGTSPTDFAGIGIDRILLTQTIPEPATFWALAGGLLGLGAIRRLRRRA